MNQALRPNLIVNECGICDYRYTTIYNPDHFNAADVLSRCRTDKPPPKSPAPHGQPPPERTMQYYRAKKRLANTLDI